MTKSSAPIRVIHNFPTWLPQTQNWMYNQVRYLPDSVECHVVCEETANLDQFGVPNLHVEATEAPESYRAGVRWKKFGIYNQAYLTRVAKRLGSQILHSHFGNIGWINLSAAKQAGMKHVVTFYGLDVNQLPRKRPYWHLRYQELFRQVDRVLCEGPHMASCIARLGCPESKLQVQRLGVRIADIEFRQRTWTPDTPLRVLISAAFREKKGVPLALEALGRFGRERPIEVTIIGDANGERRSIEEKRKILATIEKYQMNDRVRLLGYQPHEVLFKEAYDHHVFISPSITAKDGDTEGGAPVTLLDMAASGIPIVTSTHCDIPSIVKHGETGLVANEGDVEGLIDHLRWLSGHPEQWHTFAMSGRKHVEANFDAAKQSLALASVYEDLLGARAV